MHRNPVVRGLVSKPEDWPWSSYRHYATRLEGTVEVESFWTVWKREQAQTGEPMLLLPTLSANCRPKGWGTHIQGGTEV